MKTLIIFACFVAYVSAHSCLVVPAQRGGFPNNTLHKAGADACGLDNNPPCGGMHMEEPIVIYKAGMKYNATFQKNLDHYYKQKPGSWTLFLLMGKDKPMKLSSFADSDKFGTGDFCDLTFEIPKRLSASGVEDDIAMLQLVYETNNPGAPANFYQCADIMIR